MKLEKTKNARRNILFGILNKVITMFLPFVVRSVIIYALSAEYLGLNSLFSSILQVLNLTELGFSSAMVYSMYKPIAENDDETICALLNFYRKIYFIIGCIVLSLGLLLLPFLDKLINGDVPDNINIYILYLCYLVNTVLSYMMFAYRSSLLNAHQRTDVISNINTITLGSMYFLQIIVLIATKNYYTYVLMMPAFTILNNLIVAGVSRKYYPQYECKGELDSILISGIKKQTVGLMVNKICAVSRNSLDNIFVSTFLGLAATAMYGNYYYIMNAIIAILMVVSNGLLAGVGNSIVTESPEKNYSDLNKINFVYMWFAGWCTICLICLYQPFMKLWVGKKLMFPNVVAIAFGIYFYALEMGVVRGVYSDAAGLWWENRYRAIVETIANLILNYILVKCFGILGIIVATLISLLVINFGFGSQIVFKYYFKNKKLHEYFIYQMYYAFVTLVLGGVTYYIVNSIKIDGVVGLALKFLICCCVPNILYVLAYHRTNEYKIAMPWILKIFHMDWLIRIICKGQR